MPFNKAQYQALFTNAFGSDPDEFGVSIDDSTDVAVGRVGTHTVELQIVKDRPIGWQVDSVEIIEWTGVFKPSDRARSKNAETLRSSIA
jgi:hypothetical protein